VDAIDVPAYSCAFDGDCDFARLEVFALLNGRERGRCICHPEVVLWVRIDADIGLGRLDLRCRSRRHGAKLYSTQDLKVRAR